jgi:hypothetical protein
MKTSRRWSNNALALITAIFSFVLFSFSDISAAPKIFADITKTDSNLLQFRAGNHILGFAPGKAYLVSMDHALSVQFIGTKGVVPIADANAPAIEFMTKAPTLSKVVYQNLWDGISLTFEATKDGVTESIYHVAPGAEVSKIKLSYNVPVEKQKDGSLKFNFATGNVTESTPIAWQIIGEKRKAVEVAFNIKDGIIGFTVGKYDRAQPLIIDPTYQWHTFYGATGRNTAITIDGNDNIYVTGCSSESWTGPDGQSPLHAFSAGIYGNIFVLKLNSDGVYQWHTFYGLNDDYAYGIAVDGNGNLYVTGYSNESWNGPAGQLPLNAYKSHVDIVIIKLSGNGAYQWHTFYGSNGYGNDSARGIAIDGKGNIYVVGSSTALWLGPAGQFPLHAYTALYDLSNIMVLKLDSCGTYQWHTFYGSTSGYDYAYDLALDDSGNIYVAGFSANSWNGPTGQAPLNAGGGNEDAFVLKLNSSGTYQWHTFYGWGGDDSADGIAIDGSGNVYVTGFSASSWDGPTGQAPLNAWACPGGGSNIFVLKLNGSGTYKWHTFYGSCDANAIKLAIDANGNAYVTGYSYSGWNGPTGQPPLNAYSDNADIFVLKLDSGGAYKWHAFYGSPTIDDNAYSLALNGMGYLYLSGQSWNWNGPAGQSPLHAGGNIFVLKLSDDSDHPGRIRIIRGDSAANHYTTIQDAYDASVDADTIQVQTMDLTESLIFGSDISILFRGGYNPAFAVNSGMTKLNGSLTISDGTIVIENLIIK